MVSGIVWYEFAYLNIADFNAIKENQIYSVIKKLWYVLHFAKVSDPGQKLLKHIKVFDFMVIFFNISIIISIVNILLAYFRLPASRDNKCDRVQFCKKDDGAEILWAISRASGNPLCA